MRIVLLAKLLHRKKKQSYDNKIESNEQEALKDKGTVAVTSKLTSDADGPSNLDAGMDSNDFNFDFVLLQHDVITGGLGERALNDNEMELLPPNSKSNSNIFQS